MKALDVKVVRDLRRMLGQAVAIVLVIACGIGVFAGMRATMHSLESARTTYYAREHFADVFARLKRAPEHVARKLRAIPGVENVETRVVADVTLDVPGMADAAIGRLISLPDQDRPQLDDVHVRSGRLPATARWDEALVTDAFATAHGLRPGARVGAVVNGRHETLRVVGTALSPEYTYSLGPGLIFPDDRRFGVFWMRRKGLAAAFDMEGAFNDAALALEPDASVEDVISRVDQILVRYGGLGAIARKDQQSAFFIENELVQLATFALMVPALFLGVAAFLLNMVIGRTVATQREQIAVLKAFGYRDREVGLHYAKIIGVVVAAGTAAGILVAGSLGTWMTGLYARYFRFPELPLRLGPTEVLEAIAISVAAAALGAWAAIGRTVALPPADAMRPEAPPTYRPTLLERFGFAAFVPPIARIVLRELERRPFRSLLTVAGIAGATGLTVFNAFSFDSVEHLLNVQFGMVRRDDVHLTLAEPRSVGALSSIEQLPGVLWAEPLRSVPVRLRAGTRARTVTLEGMPESPVLQTVLSETFETLSLPREGLVLSRKLADVLGVDAGDRLRVEVLEGKRRATAVTVSRVAETFVGISAYMQMPALARLLGEAQTMNAASLLVDDREIGALHAEVKNIPAITSIMERDRMLRSARRLLDEHVGTWVSFGLGCSLVMALGVLYNAVRVTLAEHARELASLSVLGFRRGEIGAILFGELALLLLAGLPIGLMLGRLMAAALVSSPGFNNEQFRLPLVISPATYGLAVVTVLAGASISAWIAWRKVNAMDVVEVLKTRD